MYHVKYTPEEKLERIKLFMKYDSKKTLNENIQISEQTVVGAPNYGTSSSTNTSAAGTKSEEQKIADEFYDAGAGAGTVDDVFVASVLKIKNPEQFWNINAYLKSLPKKLDFVQTINDELDYDNFDEITQITNHLKKIGVPAEFTRLSTTGGTNRFKTGSFKVTSAPPPKVEKKVTTQTTTQTKDTQSAAPVKYTVPTELGDTEGVKKFQTWLDQNHPGWHSKYKTLGDEVLKGWGKFGPNTSRAWNNKTWKDEYMNKKVEPTKEEPKDIEADQEQVYGDNPNDILASN